MGYSTEYFWIIEMIDATEDQEDPEILDSELSSTLCGLDINPSNLALGMEQCTIRLALMRDRSNGIDMADREWAYVSAADGSLMLPSSLCDAMGREGHGVPKKYQKEFIRWASSRSQST